MSTLFETLGWNGTENLKTFIMDKESILAEIEQTGTTVVNLLKSIQKIPEGLILPVFIVSGIESVITAGIHEKEPSFMSISAFELNDIVTKLYHILDCYLLEYAQIYKDELPVDKNRYSDLVTFNESYVDEVFANYKVEGYAEISYQLLVSDLGDFTKKTYIIGLVNFLRKMNKSVALRDCLGIDETNEAEVHTTISNLFGLKLEEDLLPLNFTADDLYNIFRW